MGGLLEQRSLNDRARKERDYLLFKVSSDKVTCNYSSLLGGGKKGNLDVKCSSLTGETHVSRQDILEPESRGL